MGGGVGEHLLDPIVGRGIRLVLGSAHDVVIETGEVREGLIEPQLLQGERRRHMAIGEAHEVHVGAGAVHAHASNGPGVGRSLILPVGQLPAVLRIGLLAHIIHGAVGKLRPDAPKELRHPLLLSGGQLLLEAEIDHAGLVPGSEGLRYGHAILFPERSAAVLAMAGTVTVHAVIHDVPRGGAHVAIDAVEGDGGQQLLQYLVHIAALVTA